jgi:hypothetical protein
VSYASQWLCGACGAAPVNPQIRRGKRDGPWLVSTGCASGCGAVTFHSKWSSWTPDENRDSTE